MSSSMFDAIGIMNNSCPFESLDSSAYGVEPQQTSNWTDEPYSPNTFMERFHEFSAVPQYIPMDGFINPFVGGLWNTPTTTLDVTYNQEMFGPEKIDPNRIFSSDIASLKTLAADQAKLIKVFERKAMEMYTDKGAYGLNEDAIAAMQAATSARSALLSIIKEQASIKKNITELRIKQQQTVAGGGPAAAATPGRSASAFDVGRAIVDNIFNMPNPSSVPSPPLTQYPETSIDDASNMLENVVSVDEVPETVKFEKDNPKIHVMIGDDPNDRKYVTLNGHNEVMPDYPPPKAAIKEVDLDSRVALDELENKYPVIYKSEINADTDSVNDSV